jgi:nucleotide-binding universal stress UspA family protein
VLLHGPHQVLGDAAQDADLLVVGPRGVGAIARVVLGSVTTWLLQSSPCPVAVVPQ